MKWLALACVLAGCTTFEDPTIVLDLRVLAMRAEPPEQVIDVDLAEPPSPTDVLAQLAPTEVCALVADPGQRRSLLWKMTMCLPGDDDRCDPAHPQVELGSGVLGDPDEAMAGQELCVTVFPDQRMLSVLLAALDADILRGLGGLDFVVELQIGGEAADRELDVVGAKTVRVSPRIPDARSANNNPTIEFLDASVAGAGLVVAPCRCAQCSAMATVGAGAVVTLYPVEPETVREDYVVPTLDGQTAMLTETMTYQWLAGRGSFSDATTGGGHDLLGNQSLLGSEWRAPRGIDGDTLVPIWMIQRDERLGVSWYETCIRVTP